MPMIPDGIQVNPIEGQLDSQVDVTVESYSGRLMKDPRELFCYTKDNTAEDSVTIWQEGKQEYISINEPLVYDVPAVGDTISITGSSNSKEISIKGGDSSFIYEFYVNGEKVENWDGKTIPGDIGAKGEFTWEIKITIPENRSDDPRTWNVYFTNNEEINTGYVIINQAEGIRTYGDLVIDSFTYSPNPVSAAGGTSIPTVTYHQQWGWNGTIDDGGVITSGASMVFSGTYINSSSGNASIPSKGTTISNVTDATTSTVTVTSHGMSDTASCVIQQDKNIIISCAFTDNGAMRYDMIPASGGSSSKIQTGPNYYDRIWTYSSGASADDNGVCPVGYTWDFIDKTYAIASNLNGFTINTSNGTVTAPSRGTTIGNQWNSDTITATETCVLTPASGYEYADSLSYTYSSTATCSQEKNIPISIDAVCGYSFYPNPIGGAGGTATGQTSTHYHCNWTSGAQSYHHAGFDDSAGVTCSTTSQYTTIKSSAGATIDLTPNVTVTWTANSGGTRSVTVRRTVNITVTIDNTYGGGTLRDSASADAQSIQSTGGIQRIEVVENWSYSPTSISAAGGSSSFQANGYCNVYLATGEVVECRSAGTYNGFSITFSRTFSANMSTGFSFNSSSGAITASSRGTTLGTVRYCGTLTSTLSAVVTADSSLGGGTFNDSDSHSDTDMVSQARNTITNLTVDFRFSYSKTTLSPSGETVSPTINDKGYNVTYSSGATSNERDSIANLVTTFSSTSYSMTSKSGWSINSSNGNVTVTALPQGSTSRTSGTISGTAAYNLKDTVNNITLSADKSYTYGTLSQSANSVVSVQLIITPGTNGNGWQTPTDDEGWENLPAYTCYIGVFGTRRYTYSDGTTRDEDAGWLYVSDGLQSSVSWATSHTYGGLAVQTRSTTIGNARQGYMEWHEGGAVSNRVYFTQRGNYAESVSVSTTLTYPKNVSAAGGTVSPSRGTSYTITFTSGATYSGEPAGTTVDVSYSYSGGSATGFSAPNSAGKMTAAARGTTAGGARNSATITQTATVTITHNSTYSAGGTISGTDTDSDYATQVANAVVTSQCQNPTVSISANPTTLPASGGTSTLSYSGSYQSRSQYTSGSWTSWSTVSVTPTISGSATGFSRSGTTVTAANRGTTTGAARSVTYTATITACSQTKTATVTITQNANTLSYSSYRVKAYVQDGQVHSTTITLTNSGGYHNYIDEFRYGSTPLQRYLYIEGNATYSSGSAPGWVKINGSYQNENISSTSSIIGLNGSTTGTDSLPYKLRWAGLTIDTYPASVVTITFQVMVPNVVALSVRIFCYGVYTTSTYEDSEVPVEGASFAIGVRSNAPSVTYSASSSILQPASGTYDDGISEGIFTKLVTMARNTTSQERSISVTSVAQVSSYPILGYNGSSNISHAILITQSGKAFFDIRVAQEPTTAMPYIILRRDNGTPLTPASTLSVTMQYIWGAGGNVKTATGTWSTTASALQLPAVYTSGSSSFNVVRFSATPTSDSTYTYGWNGNAL